jgi:hypothetical protein
VEVLRWRAGGRGWRRQWSACSPWSPGAAWRRGGRTGHGSPVDPFWSSVKVAAEQAARDFNVKLDCEASQPAGSSTEPALLRQAVARHPQGLAVTIPDPLMEAPIGAAVATGRPVVAFNVDHRLVVIHGVIILVWGPVSTTPADLAKTGNIAINVWGGVVVLAAAAASASWATLKPLQIGAASTERRPPER